MQVIFENKDKGGSSGGTNPIDIIICPRWTSRYLEGECIGRFGSREDGI